MESTALVAALAAAGGVAVTLLVVVVLLGRRRRSDAELEVLLVAARAETEQLRHQVEELAARTARLEPDHADPHRAEFVITHVGEPGASDDGRSGRVAVPDRIVLSATLGEPLVKTAAFAHGVRRALSAESRNRIWFEMRREVRAARRRRRRLVKDYLRDTRARERAQESVA
jgi:hypothetical protein